MQKTNTDNMIFPIADLIFYVSEVMTLEPGDVIVTGTPGGVGFARKPPVLDEARRYLRDRDRRARRAAQSGEGGSVAPRGPGASRASKWRLR